MAVMRGGGNRRKTMHGRLSRVQNWEQLAQRAEFRPIVMASLCSVSLRQLERFFRQRFNSTPQVWARQLRCRIARQHISEGWLNKAVAAELHFGNESHLCHEFKRLLGAPPQAFAPMAFTENVAVRQERRDSTTNFI